jgi:MFS family permease
MFYGWLIVGVTSLVNFVLVGTLVYAFGPLMKSMVAELSAGERFWVSFATPFHTIVGGALGVGIGKIVDRGRIRRVMLAGALVLAASFALLSQVGALWQLLAVYALPMALGAALLGVVPVGALLSNWFAERRGLAMGMSYLGMSVAGVVFPIVTTALVEALGWRGAVGVFALAPLVLVPLIAWLIVEHPEQRGLHPDGAASAPAVVPPAAHAPEGWSVAGALRDPMILLLAVAPGLAFAANNSVLLTIHPHATDIGLAPAQAATVMSFMALVAALSKPLSGWLGDHLQLRNALWLCIGVQAGGLLLVRAADGAFALTASAGLFGLGYGGLMPLHGVVVAALWGRALFGRVMGVIHLLLLPFQLLGLPVANWVFDQTGSYRTAYLVFVGMHLAAILLLTALRMPSRAPGPAAAAQAAG